MSIASTIPHGGFTRLHLRLNGLAVLVMSIVAYIMIGGSWVLFAALILVPDIFMVGYLANKNIGATTYNIGHSLLWPVGLVVVGLIMSAGSPGAVDFSGAGAQSPETATIYLSVGLIWAAHIGMDRAVGYGYKYPSSFKDTDIGRA